MSTESESTVVSVVDDDCVHPEDSKMYMHIRDMLRCVALLNRAITDENAYGCIYNVDDLDADDDDDSSTDSDQESDHADSVESAEPMFLSVLPVVQYFVKHSGAPYKKGPWSGFLDKTSFF